jgi:hypothetical protein
MPNPVILDLLIIASSRVSKTGGGAALAPALVIDLMGGTAYIPHGKESPENRRSG